MPVVYVCSRPCEYFTLVTLEIDDFSNFASFVLIFLYFNPMYVTPEMCHLHEAKYLQCCSLFVLCIYLCRASKKITRFRCVTVYPLRFITIQKWRPLLVMKFQKHNSQLGLGKSDCLLLFM